MYETIRCWCDKFGKDFAQRAKAARRKPGSTWHREEMFVTLCGEPYLLWHAVDEHGTELDILLQKRRDKAAAKRFVKRVLRSYPVPRKIVTDQLRSYPAAKAEIPELQGVKHVFVEAAARLTIGLEQPSSDARARASHAGLSRRETYTAHPRARWSRKSAGRTRMLDLCPKSEPCSRPTRSHFDH